MKRSIFDYEGPKRDGNDYTKNFAYFKRDKRRNFEVDKVIKSCPNEQIQLLPKEIEKNLSNLMSNEEPNKETDKISITKYSLSENQPSLATRESYCPIINYK